MSSMLRLVIGKLQKQPLASFPLGDSEKLGIFFLSSEQILNRDYRHEKRFIFRRSAIIAELEADQQCPLGCSPAKG